MVYRQEIGTLTVGQFRELLKSFPDDANVIFEERLFYTEDPNSITFANDLVYDDWTNEVIIIKGPTVTHLGMEKYHDK